MKKSNKSYMGIFMFSYIFLIVVNLNDYWSVTSCQYYDGPGLCEYQNKGKLQNGRLNNRKNNYTVLL